VWRETKRLRRVTESRSQCCSAAGVSPRRTHSPTHACRLRAAPAAAPLPGHCTASHRQGSAASVRASLGQRESRSGDQHPHDVAGRHEDVRGGLTAGGARMPRLTYTWHRGSSGVSWDDTAPRGRRS